MSNTPQIRFAGFTDAWEQRKFSDFTFAAGERNKDDLDLEPFAITNNQGFIAQSEAHDDFGYMKDVDRNMYIVVKPNSFAYNPARINVGSLGYYEGAENVIVSSLYEVFQTAEYVDDKFLKHWFKTKAFQDWIERLQEGSVRLYFYYDKLCECIMNMPSVEEQRRIGAYLDKIDNLITLHQRKCDALQKFKKSMLQKMFPQNGESVPEIRFAGFTDAWEQREFSDIAETRRGLTYKPNSIVDNGVRVLRSSNINEDTFVFGNDDVFVDENAVNIPYIQNGDILITSANGSSRLVGKHAIIRNLPDNSAVHGGFMLIASSSNPEFLNASMSSQWYSEFISLYVAGGNGAIGNLNKNDLDTQIVLVPSVAEQQQIGSYFRNLDHLITLHQRKLETLQKMKKSLLQKMFV